jgi:DNA primase large subunit
VARDESYIKRLAARVAEDIEEAYGVPPNFIELQALIRRFVENNPDADPENIDWVGVYDPRLEYSEIVKAFKRKYPMYRWEEEEQYGEERYLQELYNYLLAQARDLPEDLRARLIKDLALELGVQPPTIQRVQKAEAVAVEAGPAAKAEVIEKPKKITITLEVLAKYPILPEMSRFLSGVSVRQMPGEVFERAFERVVEALEKGEVKKASDNHYIEVLSYPAAVMLVTAIGNEWLKRRWALAEAMRVERQLDIEDDAVFDFIASKLGFEKVAEDIDVDHDMLRAYEYRVPVARYLKVIGDLLRDPRWKLVNQMVHRGYVYVRSRAEVSRIVREIMKGLLLKKLSTVSPRDVPSDLPVWEYAERLKALLPERMPRHIAAATMAAKAGGEIPPCITAMLAKIANGEDISHVENFTVAAYLLNTGHSVDEVIEVFRNRSDFNEKIARYQVEHIAGLRGSRTRYRPPSCAKMRTYGLCVEDGRKCPRGVRNPLDYHVLRPGKREVEGNAC